MKEPARLFTPDPRINTFAAETIDCLRALTLRESPDILPTVSTGGTTLRLKDKTPIRSAAGSSGGSQILFGLVAVDFTGGTQLTVYPIPIDIGSMDPIPATVLVYVLNTRQAYAMSNGTKVVGSQNTVVPYVKGSDGNYYVIGSPRLIITRLGNGQFRTRDDWGTFCGTESNPVNGIVGEWFTVTLQQTGGYAGDGGITCSFVYTAMNLSGTLVGVNLAPEFSAARVVKCMCAAATRGACYWDGAAMRLAIANETQTQCNGTCS